MPVILQRSAYSILLGNKGPLQWSRSEANLHLLPPYPSSLQSATLWFQRANYSQTAPLKTKGVLTSRGKVMVPNAAKLWVWSQECEIRREITWQLNYGRASAQPSSPENLFIHGGIGVFAAHGAAQRTTGPKYRLLAACGASEALIRELCRSWKPDNGGLAVDQLLESRKRNFHDAPLRNWGLGGLSPGPGCHGASA